MKKNKHLQSFCNSFYGCYRYSSSEHIWRIERYRELLKEYGYEKPALGTAEAQLKNLVKPMKSIPIASRVQFKADETLANPKGKADSFQFEVPNDLHVEIMKKLVRQFAGKTYFRDIEILVWDIACLKTFLHPCKL